MYCGCITCVSPCAARDVYKRQGEKLWETVNTILSEPGRAEEIGKNAKAMAVLDANDRIYNIICEKAKK